MELSRSFSRGGFNKAGGASGNNNNNRSGPPRQGNNQQQSQQNQFNRRNDNRSYNDYNERNRGAGAGPNRFNNGKFFYSCSLRVFEISSFATNNIFGLYLLFIISQVDPQTGFLSAMLNPWPNLSLNLGLLLDISISRGSNFVVELCSIFELLMQF